MYTVHDTLLGNTPAAPSLWDSFSNLVSTGVNAGFNIYNRTQQIKQQQQQTAAIQNLALQQQQMAAIAYTQPMTGVRPGMISYISEGSGWLLPVALGGGVLVLLIALRK